MKNRFYIILVISLFGLGANAQQDPLYTQYRTNMLTINPAYAGSRDALTVALLHRSQWVGLDGAPTTQTLSVHGPMLNKNFGLGLSLIHDRIGPNRQTGVFADFAGRVRLNNDAYLAGGIKVGINFLNANLTELNLGEAGDQVFGLNSSTSLANVGFGVYYYTAKWFAGVSMPRIFTNELFDNPADSGITEKRHYFATGGFVMDISPAIQFKPTALIRVVNGAPGSLDLTATFVFNEKLWVGAFHRWQESVGIILDYNFTPQLKVGYSYDFTLTDLQDFNSGSHEISLIYDFIFSDQKIKSPRYF